MSEMFDPPHPGRILTSALDALKLSTEQFASNLGLSSESIAQVISGEAPVTPELAVKFVSAISGPDSAMWLSMQATYDNWQRKQRDSQDH